MPHPITSDLLPLLKEQVAPCISIYQPTHRRHPENQQDPIRYKVLLKKIEESLQEKYPRKDVQPLLEPFQKLVHNTKFWNHTLDGLAVLGNGKVFKIFQIQRTVPELAIVADSFHFKPLLRYLQSADRFHVLALTKETASILAGNRYVLDMETPPDDFPTFREEVVPESSREPGLAIASSSGGVGSPKMARGHVEDKDDIETEKFFRAVEREFTARFSRPSGLPLILAAQPEQQALFRKISQNPLLLDTGIVGNPAAMSTDELRTEAWNVLQPYYLAKLEEHKESFTTAQARQLGSADLSDVARAAVEARVATLLVEAERVIPGKIDRATGAIEREPGKLNDPAIDDLLDDLAELVLQYNGEVVIVPKDRMPSQSGLAAIYRF